MSLPHVRLPARQDLADRLYAWWWWRSLNRPRISDTTYLELLDAVPEGSIGLDLGSRDRVRADAVTVDVVAAEGVDVVADGHDLPFVDGTFDYVWCNAVLEHVRNPFMVAAEIVRVLRPGGLAVIQVPFLESIHSWPHDYFRFTQNGLRELFRELDEVAVGTSAGPGQVLPDLLEQYAAGFAEIHGGSLLVNLWMVVLGVLLWPLRALDMLIRHRPRYWGWARAYYYAGRKRAQFDTTALYIAPDATGVGFEEVMSLRAREHGRALGRSGIDVVAVAVDTAANAEADGARSALALRPDIMLAPNLNYFLAGARSETSLVAAADTRPILMWDDPLGALALSLQDRRGVEMGDVGESRGDALAEFASHLHLGNPHHFSWDSGHIDVMTQLGLIENGSASWYPIATYDPFIARGAAPAEPERDLAFCGNVYNAAVDRSPFSRTEPHASIAGAVTRAKAADLERPVWELLEQELGSFDEDARARAGLDVHDARFWDFYIYLVWLSANTAPRLELLTGLNRTVEMFGVFGDPDSVAHLENEPRLLYRGNAHQFRELPDVFATTRINICPSNALIHSGVPSKFVDCIASGGFALVDPKPDLVSLFGPEIEAVFFRNAEELAAKVEYFLARPDERREILAGLRATVVRECTLDALFRRVRALI